MLTRLIPAARRATVSISRRHQSTGAVATPSATTAPLSAASADRPKVLTTAEANARAFVISPHWARYSVGKSANTFDLAEARKVPVLSSVTENNAGRKAVIHRVSNHAMSSGQSASRWWAIRMNHVDKWSNPLMSWLSSAETMNPLVMHLKFDSVEQAILFCERNGLSYEVNPGAINSRTPGRVDNLYQYNFVSKEVLATMKALGPRKSRAIFANDKAGTPTWINLRRTQFGKEPWKPANYQTETAWTGEPWPGKKAQPGSAETH